MLDEPHEGGDHHPGGDEGSHEADRQQSGLLRLDVALEQGKHACPKQRGDGQEERELGRRPPLDAVILGCTHYPALKGVLAQILGPGVTLVDSAESVAAVVKAELARLELLAPAGGPASVHYIVTGDIPTFLHATDMLAGPKGTFEHMNVADLARALRAPGFATEAPSHEQAVSS